MTPPINNNSSKGASEPSAAPISTTENGLTQAPAISTSQKINTLAIVVLGRFILPTALVVLGIVGSKYLSAFLKSQTTFAYSPLVKTLGKCSVTYIGLRAAEACSSQAKIAVKSIPVHSLAQYIFQDLLGGAFNASYNYLTQDAIDTRIEQSLLTAVTGQDAPPEFSADQAPNPAPAKAS